MLHWDQPFQPQTVRGLGWYTSFETRWLDVVTQAIFQPTSPFEKVDQLNQLNRKRVSPIQHTKKTTNQKRLNLWNTWKQEAKARIRFSLELLLVPSTTSSGLQIRLFPSESNTQRYRSCISKLYCPFRDIVFHLKNDVFKVNVAYFIHLQVAFLSFLALQRPWDKLYRNIFVWRTATLTKFSIIYGM